MYIYMSIIPFFSLFYNLKNLRANMFSYDPFGYQTWDDLNLFAGEIKTVYPH